MINKLKKSIHDNSLTADNTVIYDVERFTISCGESCSNSGCLLM